MGGNHDHNEEIKILQYTFLTNSAFILTLILCFKKIRQVRGDQEAFATKLKVLESKNHLSGKIASKFHQKMIKLSTVGSASNSNVESPSILRQSNMRGRRSQS